MIFMWYRRLLARLLKGTQAQVIQRFPAKEAARRNAALQRMIDVLLGKEPAA